MEVVNARSRIIYTRYLPCNEKSKFRTRCCVKSLSPSIDTQVAGVSKHPQFVASPCLHTETSQLSPDSFAVFAASDIDSPCESRSSYVFSILLTYSSSCRLRLASEHEEIALLFPTWGIGGHHPPVTGFSHRFTAHLYNS